MTQHSVDLNQKYHHDLACSNIKGEVLVYPVKRVLMQQNNPLRMWTMIKSLKKAITSEHKEALWKEPQSEAK